MLRNHSIMSGKAPKAHEISVFGVLTTLRNQQVMCSNHTTSSKNTRFCTEIGCFSNFLAQFIVGQRVGQNFDPHRDPHAETPGKSKTAPERKLPPFPMQLSCIGALSDLCHEVSHLLRGLLLHLPRGVGVGAEREACVVVPEHTGERFDIYAVLQCHGGERVSEIVESDVGQPCPFQHPAVKQHHRVRVVHPTCF